MFGKLIVRGFGSYRALYHRESISSNRGNCFYRLNLSNWYLMNGVIKSEIFQRA